jgi:hypothetical protein
MEKKNRAAVNRGDSLSVMSFTSPEAASGDAVDG